MSKKARIYIISQTHWDREWYFTFEQFRFRLVGMMDRLLELLKRDREFKHFILDGQTSVLEDYLEIRPERRAELIRLIRQGRLVVGPWYVMPDEFLVSGESIIRNLQLGRRMGKEFGGGSTAGYLPDPFGHLAQMPQILQGFDIDNIFFMRGMIPAEKIGTEFRWMAPDGKNDLNAVWIRNGYGNASLMGYPFNWGDISKAEFNPETAMTDIAREIESLTPHTRCGALIFYNGADHLDAQKELSSILRAARKRFPNHEFIHATHEMFLEEVRKARGKMKTVQGELRSGRYQDILAGVLSARMYLKQLNRQCEALLERWAEPSSAWTRHSGGPDQRPFLRQAWKYLLQNHPHDSICGCSTDEVHRENVSRFEKAIQLGETILETNLKATAKQVDTSHPKAKTALMVWNPLPTTRSGLAEAEILLPADHPKKFRVVDAKGEAVPQQIAFLGCKNVAPFTEMTETLQRFRISLDVPTAGIGYETFWLLPGAAKSAANTDWAKKANAKGVETEHYRIRFHSNGSFDLFDKQTGARHNRMLVFEDTEDIGDEYDYSPAKKSQTLTTAKIPAKIKIIERGPLFVTYEILHQWRIPAGFDTKQGSRTAKTVPFTLRTEMKVTLNQRRIEFLTKLDNQAKDHRLRIRFGTPAEAKKSISDGHFAIVDHPIDVKNSPENRQPNPTTFHLRHFAAVAGKGKGVAVLGRALTEYEVVREPRGKKSLALTLLRCVGKLSHGDMLTRKTAAGPELATPEAQCLGPHRFQFALLPFSGGDPAKEITPEAESYATAVRITLEGIHEGDQPSKQKFVETNNPSIVFSAWKPADKGQGSVLRLYNPGKRQRSVDLKLNLPVKIEGFCDLKEDLCKKIRGKADGAKLKLSACQIESVKIG